MTVIISVLSLFITFLVAFIAPLIAWAVARQQINVAAREAWLREFRNQVAAFLAADASLRRHAPTHTTGDPEKEQRLAAINDALSPAYYVLKLLVAEKGESWEGIGRTLDAVMNADEKKARALRKSLLTEAQAILSSERENIAADRGMLGALKAALRPAPRPERPMLADLP